MRPYFLPASLLLCLALSGCQQYRECFQFAETWRLNFNVIDKNTGLNAFFSAKPKFQLSEVKAVDVLSEGSSPQLRHKHNSTDEYLSLSFKHMQTGVILQYNEQEADTLEIKYNFEHAQCCPELTGYDIMVNSEVLCRSCGTDNPAIITH